MVSGTSAGRMTSVLNACLPRNWKRTSASATATPSSVVTAAVTSAIHSEVLNAVITCSLVSSLAYHCRLKPVSGKPPNIDALNDSTMVAMIGANRKM